MKPRPGPPPSSAPAKKPEAKPASSTSPLRQESGPSAAPAKDPTTEAPKTGLKKSTKRETTGEEVSRAFERGAVTLAGVIGVTDAQRDAIKNRAFTFLREHRTKEALPLLEGLVALDPFDVWVLVALATLKIDAGELPLAAALLDRALIVEPRDPAAKALRAEVKFKSGDVDGAVADLDALAGSEVPAVRRVRSMLPAKEPEPEPATLKMQRPPSKVQSQASQNPVTNTKLQRPATASTVEQNPVTNTKLQRPQTSTASGQAATSSVKLQRPPSKKP